MKLIRATNSGIVTSIGDVMYTITHDTASEFSDEIASELVEKFGPLIEVTDIPQVADEEVLAPVEAKPKKRVVKKKK